MYIHFGERTLLFKNSRDSCKWKTGKVFRRNGEHSTILGDEEISSHSEKRGKLFPGFSLCLSHPPQPSSLPILTSKFTLSSRTNIFIVRVNSNWVPAENKMRNNKWNFPLFEVFHRKHTAGGWNLKIMWYFRMRTFHRQSAIQFQMIFQVNFSRILSSGNNFSFPSHMQWKFEKI